MGSRFLAPAALALAIFIGAPAVCSAQFTETQKGTGVGALVGAGTGAIVGAAVGHPIVGTLIGAGVGGVGGYAVGSALQTQQNMNYRNEREVLSQQRQIERQRHEIQQLQMEQNTE
jgi:phage tail tape-measure protein